MRHTLVSLIVSVFLALLSANAQVSNLVVNGGSTFAMTSGDTISWEYDLPTGATALLKIWFDVNANGTIEPGTDVLYAAFQQRDGGTEGHGPPDLDFTENGHIFFAQPVGIAPGHYIFSATHGGVTLQVAGNVSPLASPVHSISGHVTPPTGKGAANIIVNLERDSEHGGVSFWDAVTDSLGNFVVRMSADTLGNPWRLRVNTTFGASIITPDAYEVTISGNHGGYNFTFQSPAAQVAGVVRDENGNPLADRVVMLSKFMMYNWRMARTDELGFFQIGLLSSELNGGIWQLQTETDGGETTNEMRAIRSNFPITSGDSLFKTLTIYNANAQIRGRVILNGVPPDFPILVVAARSDTAEATVLCEPGTGNFTISVSDKLGPYSLFPGLLQGNFSSSAPACWAGDTGIVMTVTVTGVDDDVAGKPSQFRLEQNYPNPFNPTTTISYELGTDARIVIGLYNVLGQKVMNLFEGEQNAGMHRLLLDGSSLTSGVYFYRIEGRSLTGPRESFTMVRKMTVMK